MNEVLSLLGMRNSKPVTIPCVRTPVLHETELLGHSDLEAYQQAVGKLVWMSGDRPDLSYSIKELSRATTAPRVAHQIALKCVLRYLRHAGDWYMRLEVVPDVSSAFQVVTDSSWADEAGRKSTTGGFGGVPSWTLVQDPADHCTQLL